MDAAGVIVAACAMIAGIVAAIAIIGVTHEIFRPAAVERRHKKRLARDEDRAARRPHIHDWDRWSEPQERLVYAAGTTASQSDNRLPVKRRYIQTRECRDCGLVERRTET